MCWTLGHPSGTQQQADRLWLVTTKKQSEYIDSHGVADRGISMYALQRLSVILRAAPLDGTSRYNTIDPHRYRLH